EKEKPKGTKKILTAFRLLALLSALSALPAPFSWGKAQAALTLSPALWTDDAIAISPPSPMISSSLGGDPSWGNKKKLSKPKEAKYTEEKLTKKRPKGAVMLQSASLHSSHKACAAAEMSSAPAHSTSNK
ncbi:hypothetical protein C0991_001434, partial [Blastosporella zonata]